eukprot:scaffold113876_cov45-Phaeocystis_antarctica.AAC.1
MHTFEQWRSRHGGVVAEDRRVRSAEPVTMPLTAARVAVLSELLRQWTTSDVPGGAASPPPIGPKPAVRLSLEAPELRLLLFAAAPPAPPPPPHATGRAIATATPAAAAAAAATEVERQQAPSPGKLTGVGGAEAAGGEAEALLLRLAVSAPRLELASAEIAEIAEIATSTSEIATSPRDRGRIHRGAARARALHVFNEHPAAAYPELLAPAEELLQAEVPAGDGDAADDDSEAAGLLRFDCRARQDERGVVVEEATLLLGGVSLRLDLKSAKALVAALAQ